MKMSGLAESRDALCLKCYAQSLSVLSFFLTNAKAGVESEKRNCAVLTRAMTHRREG